MLIHQGRQLLTTNTAVRQVLTPLVGQLTRSKATSSCTWDYETEKKNFTLTAPAKYNFARDVIDRWADREKKGERNNNPAFWWTDESGRELKWNFQDISYQSKLVANVLTGPCKLKQNDVVIVILPRIPQWWAINVAAIRAGVILSPGTTLLRPHDIRYRINASQAKCIITTEQCADLVDEVASECPSLQSKVIVTNDNVNKKTRSDWMNFDELVRKSSDNFLCCDSNSSDPMTIFFTSGTTGAPKMTEHSHSSYGLGHVITAKYFLDLNPSDVFWNLSDTGWAKSAWSSLFAPWIAGACVFAQDSAKFDPKKTIQTVSRYPISLFCAPATAIRYMMKEDVRHGFKSVKRCLSAGEPVNPEMLEEWEHGTGLKLYEGYGQTETTFLGGTYPCIEQRPGSMGKAAPGYDVEIIDDYGQVVPRGTEGNIGIRYKPVRPVGLFTRYIDDDERMEKAFVGDFFLTGDRAVMDDDDYIWFVGRADDVINSAGYRIGPFDVESALLEHPAVLESAVVSSPDKTRGEIVKAFVMLTDGYQSADKESLAKELQEHTKKVTAPYKYPRNIEFVQALPKTVSGKIRRVELRNKEWGRNTD